MSESASMAVKIVSHLENLFPEHLSVGSGRCVGCRLVRHLTNGLVIVISARRRARDGQLLFDIDLLDLIGFDQMSREERLLFRAPDQLGGQYTREEAEQVLNRVVSIPYKPLAPEHAGLPNAGDTYDHQVQARPVVGQSGVCYRSARS